MLMRELYLVVDDVVNPLVVGGPPDQRIGGAVEWPQAHSSSAMLGVVSLDLAPFHHCPPTSQIPSSMMRCRCGQMLDSHDPQASYDQSWNTLPAIAAIAPDLVIFEAGIVNDWDDKVRFRR
jgi:hypothetical protein